MEYAGNRDSFHAKKSVFPNGLVNSLRNPNFHNPQHPVYFSENKHKMQRLFF